MTTFYNEHDRDALQWLRNLSADGLIPAGQFDGRDIQEVKADDVRGYRTCHWFAGIGGWPFALELAGWDPTRPVWTASCPCQPWSNAGRGEGEADPRHLWPVLLELIAECRPPTIFGEQVESKAGRRWLAGVRADLEALGYRFGAADLCAASAGEKAEGRVRHGDQIRYERIAVGAPQIRQRLFWVADTIGERTDTRRVGRIQGGQRERRDQPSSGGQVGGMADRDGRGRKLEQEPDGLEEQPGQQASRRIDAGGRGEPHRLGDSRQSRPAGRASEPGDDGPELPTPERTGGHAGFWSNFDLIGCLDGKARRVESGLECLVAGVPFRLADGRTLEGVSRSACLKGFGNAIVPELAAEFILAYMETA